MLHRANIMWFVVVIQDVAKVYRHNIPIHTFHTMWIYASVAMSV